MLSLAVPGGFAQPQNVRDVIELYLAHARRELAPLAFEGRKISLDDFAGQFGALPLAECKPFHLQLWLDAHPAWRSNWTRKRNVAGVQRAFNWAVRLGLLATNPFRGISVENGERGSPMELGEFQAMLRHSPAPFRRLLIALRWTGARPGELAGATWPDVDWERCCIELKRHKTAKKTGRPRRIVLHPVVLGLLRWLRNGRPRGPLIFENSHGTRWTNPAIAWHIRQLREAGHIKPTTTLYGLRFLFAVQATLKGIDVLTLMPLMGHVRISTTAYYADVAKRTDHLQDALGRIFKSK